MSSASLPSVPRNLFLGVAGWSHADWRDLLVAATAPREFAELARLSEMFNLVEITSAYYHPPDVNTARSWVAQVRANPAFRFTARLWQKLVRERSATSQGDVRTAKRGLEPLLEAGRLGALVVQFSQSFRFSESNAEWLLSLLDAFVEFPLVVEIYHHSWDKSDLFRRLRHRGVGLAHVDQPRMEQILEFDRLRPGALAYLRLYGRNQQRWLAADASRDERYDYRYGPEERSALVHKVRLLCQDTAACYVVFNNYPKGQALADALQVQFALTGLRVPVPPGLLAHHPELAELAQGERPRQLEMFKESD